MITLYNLRADSVSYVIRIGECVSQGRYFVFLRPSDLGVLGEIPFLQIGIPGVLSIYFDVFSGLLQAYIFAMLTMMYVSGGFPLEEYMAKKNKKKLKKS